MTVNRAAEKHLQQGFAYDHLTQTAFIRCPTCMLRIECPQYSKHGYEYSELAIRLLLTEFLSQHMEGRKPND